jgi:hypothetical protein
VRRERLAETVTVGLLGFLARGGLPDGVDVDVEVPRAVGAGGAVRDPWNAWVFRLSSDQQFESEASNRQWTWEFNATADRVTDRWKLSFGVSGEQQRETFDLDEDEPFTVTRRERQADWFIAKSLGEHWSAGVDGDVDVSTFDNVRLRTGVAPAIEFNLFPYSQYATRQLRVEYAAGVEHSRYYETTLFGRLRETRGQHQVSVTLDQRQPWGTLQAGVEWRQYLHDLSKSRLEFEGELSVRVARGLSLEFSGTASRIRDRLSLPLRGATPEEVLLRLRQLQSGHEVNVSFGVAYSFGSIFNSVVNPRFGR